MTDQDEESFISFLLGIANFQLLESFGPTKDAIWVDRFAPRQDGHWQYFIWNRAFPWSPEYGRVTGSKSGSRKGWYYLANCSTAPLIEYDRHNFEDKRGVKGRIYWAKSFAAPNGLDYDVDEFTKWYNRITRWLRKEGKQLEKGSYNTYYLPDA